MGATNFGARLLDISEWFRRRALVAYAMAVLAFGLALAVRFAVNGALPSGFPYLTFFPAVLLTAFFCGTRAGIVTAVLSIFAAWYWFIPPFDSFVLDGQSTVAVLFFVAILSADIFIIHVMHSALRRLGSEQVRTAELLQRQHTLFEELQHRTANNMAFIGALLTIHKRKVRDHAEAAAVFDDASARLQSMARIHRRLYDPTNSDLPVGAYLQSLLEDVLQSAGKAEVEVVVQTRIGNLDVNRLITLSLLLSELATNAIKHAFAEGRGRLQVDLRTEGDDIILLVRDDGPGYPPDFDPANSERLGFRVMSSFARTLNGQLDFASDGGAVTTLVFPARTDRDGA